MPGLSVCKVGCQSPKEQEWGQFLDGTTAMKEDKAKESSASGNGEGKGTRNWVWPLYHCEALKSTIKTKAWELVRWLSG